MVVVVVVDSGGGQWLRRNIFLVLGVGVHVEI